jgi:hypothetical protein
MEDIRKKWLAFAIGGILIMGFGLSLHGEATNLKASGSAFQDWFILGTGALIAFFAGLSLFGQAVVYKVILHQSNPNSKRKTIN